MAAVYGFARRLHGTHLMALRAAALWICVPAANIAGVFATPDTPLLLFWVLAAWAFYEEKHVLTGVLLGLAMLSKYTAVLLPLAWVVEALWRRRVTKSLILTGVVSLLVFSPVLVWNYQHAGMGFGFQWKHGTAASHSGGVMSFLEFLAGQAVMAGPVLLLWLGVKLPREKESLFWMKGAVFIPLLVFGWASWRTRGEANWPAAAYLVACVLMAKAPGVWRHTALATGWAILTGGMVYLTVPLGAPNSTALKRTHGWSVLSQLRDIPASAIFAPHYGLAAEASHYSGLPAFAMREEGRLSQFDVWGPPELKEGDVALWVSENETESPPEKLRASFRSVEGPIEFPSDFGGTRIHTFYVWMLMGYSDSALARAVE